MKNQSSSIAQKPSSLQFRKLFVWKAMLSVILLLTLSFIGGQGHAQAAADAHFNALFYNTNLACPYDNIAYAIPISGITLTRDTGDEIAIVPAANRGVVDVVYNGFDQGLFSLNYFRAVNGRIEIEVYTYYDSPTSYHDVVDACNNWSV